VNGVAQGRLGPRQNLRRHGDGEPAQVRVRAVAAYLWDESPTAMSFTKGPSISLAYEQVEDLISQLSTGEKLRLAQKLDKELARQRLRELFDEIRPKKPVSEAEILKVSKQVRKRVAARYRREAASGRR